MPRPAGLQDYQIVIQPGILYRVWANQSLSRAVKNGSAAQLAPSIEIIGDTVGVYGSQVLPDSPPTGMGVLLDEVIGVRAFTVIPNYIYVDGSPTSIVLSGVGAAEIAQLSAKNQITTFVKANLVLVA